MNLWKHPFYGIPLDDCFWNEKSEMRSPMILLPRWWYKTFIKILCMSKLKKSRWDKTKNTFNVMTWWDRWFYNVIQETQDFFGYLSTNVCKVYYALDLHNAFDIFRHANTEQIQIGRTYVSDFVNIVSLYIVPPWWLGRKKIWKFVTWKFVKNAFVSTKTAKTVS